MKLKMNYRGKNGKGINTWELNNHWFTKKKKNRSMIKLKRKSKNSSRQTKMKQNFPKSMGCSKSNSKE